VASPPSEEPRAPRPTALSPGELQPRAGWVTRHGALPRRVVGTQLHASEGLEKSVAHVTAVMNKSGWLEFLLGSWSLTLTHSGSGSEQRGSLSIS